MFFSGQHGYLQLGDGDLTTEGPSIGRLKNWSYTTQQSPLDTTCLTSTDKTIIQGVRSTTGQASLLYYEEAGSNVQRVSEHLIKPVSGDPDLPGFGSSADAPNLVKVRLSLGPGSTSSSRAVAMYAHLTSFSMTCSVGEVVSADITWEAHGPVYEFDY
jgi:hypothetical protein